MTATLVVAHHEDHDGLKEAARAVVAAAKESNAAPSHLVYKPVAGTIPAGQDDKLKFVWVREDGGDANAPALADARGDSGAADLIEAAREGINGVGSRQLERTRSGGSPSGTPQNVMAIGFTYDAAKADAIKEAADAFDEANSAAGTPFSYTVYKTDVEGGRLILLQAENIRDAVKEPLLTTHLGADKAQEIRSKLEDAVNIAYAVPLELVPALSNA